MSPNPSPTSASGETPVAVGIDGCRGGWLAAWRSSDGVWHTQVFKELGTLARRFAGAARALIDMPIGLPDNAARECDALARRLLGRRACTVFSVPCRKAAYAPDYPRACDANERALGRRLSRQSYNLLAKIRELDTLLRAGAPLALVEAHPELCFMALNGGPVPDSKRTAAGRAVRRVLLLPHCPVDHLLAEAHHGDRAALSPDDVLDALVLAVAAQWPARLASLPPLPRRDACALPMAIHYGPCGFARPCAGAVLRR